MERKTGALAYIAEERMHPARYDAVAAGRGTADSTVRRSPQQRAPAQRHRLRGPTDMLAGRQKEIQAALDRKLEEVRRGRQIRRQQAG